MKYLLQKRGFTLIEILVVVFHNVILNLFQDLTTVIKAVRFQIKFGMTPIFRGGFTLIEILVVVLIIGILGAIALPQYQRAVLKSRFAALMPIAKSMADSNEAFYLEHGEYADNAEDLPIQGRRNYSDGTELSFGTTTSHAYVLATRDNDFPNKYIVYQKHSEQFPGEIHCEAASDNTLAQDVCKSFGPTQDIGETLTSGYLTYVLFGTGNGEAPTGDEGGDTPSEPETPTCPDNSVCDEEGDVTGCANGYHLNGDECVETLACPIGATCNSQGVITRCPSGQTLNNGICEDCTTAFPGAVTCYRSQYKAMSCETGYNLTNSGTCVYIMTAAEAQAFADEHCYYAASKGTGCVGIANSDGTVSVCENYTGSVNSTGECVYNDNSHQIGTFEAVYNPDGTIKSKVMCSSMENLHCNGTALSTYNPDGSYLYQSRYCANGDGANKDLTCPNNAYGYSHDGYYDTQNNAIASYECSSVASNGKCTAYSEMTAYDTIYTNGNKTGEVIKNCMSISETTCENNNYKPTYAYTSVEGSSNNRWIRCYNSNGSSSSAINADGSCPSGYTWQQKDPDGTYKACSGGDQPTGINWNTVTCS